MFDVQQRQSREFVIDNEDILLLGTRLCVSDVVELRKEIMEETYFLPIVFIQVLLRCIMI